MADVADVNPLKPIWPTRPDGRQKKRQPEEEKGSGKEKPSADDKDGESDGHIDEYA